LSTAENESGSITEYFGYRSCFTIYVLSFNDLELKKAINDIKYKHENKIPLNDEDLVKLALIPFLGNEENLLELLEWSCNILMEIELENKEKLYDLQSIQILLINKFVKDLNFKNKLLDVIEMCDNLIFERYARPYFDKGREEGRKEVKEEYIAEGILIGEKNKEKEYVNRLLDGGYPLEDISLITGLSFDEINVLR